ncbi:acyltransferase family protein [Henriciella marina]|uniref:Acyltransferase n=1 Tax=Henriciella marina TaxID=453851 RepID=A0ABT4LUD0_9PROT|nr:acyltransferase [Henriciella marina]MCZ4297916.1 acyltransferase [Henriciella marina]
MKPVSLANPNRIDGLEACRAVAAMLVMLFHLGESYSGEPLFDLFKRGYAGVDLFFVISGFIIFRTLKPGSSIKRFAAKRFLIIFPPYWVILSLYVLTFGLASIFLPGFERDLSPDRLVVSYFLLPSYDHIISIAWTLSCEILFYLVAGLTYLCLGPRYCVATIFLWGAVNWVLALNGIGRGWLPLSPIFLEFLFGIIAALAYDKTQYQHPIRAALIAIAGTVSLAFSLFLGSDAMIENWGRVIIFGVPSAAIVYGISGIPLRLSTVVIQMGGASYILYLSHVLIFLIFRRLLAYVGANNEYFEIIILCIISVGTALIAHVKLELPYQEWYRARLRRSEAFHLKNQNRKVNGN